MASLPTPIRATLGLLATALDAVQELVDHAPEIPMEAVGNSMQLSMRLQQQYVALLTRGDEFLASLRGAPEEPPAWATFDEPPPPDPGADLTDAGPTGTDLSDDGLFTEAAADAVDDLPEAEIQDGPRHAGQGDPLLAAATRSRPVPAAKVAAKKSPAKKVAAKKVPATKVAAKKAPATTADRAEAAPATKAAAKAAKAPGVKAGRRAAQAAAPAPGSAGPILTAPQTTGPAKRGRPAKTTGPAKTTNPAKTTSPAKTTNPAKATGPAKRGRPAKKASAAKATAAPQLDASLTAGTTSARHQSAFDLAATPTDVGTDGIDALSAALTEAALTEAALTEADATDPATTE